MPDKNKIVAVDSKKPESDIINRAGEIIKKSGVVIFPAQCLYGVAANALNQKAVKKVFDLKQRPFNNPILILIHDQTQLSDLVQTVPASAKLLMNTFWPGNLTIVFNATDKIPDILTAGSRKIGVRMPAHPVAKALVKSVKIPITGTSANLSGQMSCSKTSQLDQSIIDQADLILNAGKLRGGTGSSIVDVTSSKIKIIRSGSISASRIYETLDKFHNFP